MPNIANIGGFDISGTISQRANNAPQGMFYYATDTKQFFVCVDGDNSWLDTALDNAANDLDDALWGTPGAETANAITTTLQLRDLANNNLAVVGYVNIWLASDSTGDTLTTDIPSTGITAGTDGAIIADHLANGISVRAESEADGDIDVVVTDTGVGTWYLVCETPAGRIVSTALTFA